MLSCRRHATVKKFEHATRNESAGRLCAAPNFHGELKKNKMLEVERYLPRIAGDADANDCSGVVKQIGYNNDKALFDAPGESLNTKPPI